MQNPSDYPPKYADVVQSQPINPQGISQHMNAVPTVPQQHYYPPVVNQPIYPTPPQQFYQPQPIVNVVQPIPTAPPQNSYGTINETTITIPTEIMVVGGCPACRIGVLDDNYPCCAICCAIVCFPIGLICCLAMRNKQCTNCGAEF